jgi:hypothetical protein
MILEMITKRDVVPPREVIPAIPRELDDIIMRALRKDPEERFQNAQEMQLALEEFLRDCGRASSSSDLSVYLRGLFTDHIEEKRKILELASREDIQEVDFDDESTQQAKPRAAAPSQMRHAAPSQPQFQQPTQGMIYPPHAAASGMMPQHAVGSSGGYYQPTYPPDEGQSWVARTVIIGALLVIAFASYVLYRQLTKDQEVAAIYDSGVHEVLEPVRAGTLKLETVPQGARIILDGQAMRTGDGTDARTPSDLQGLAYGKQFDIVFEKEGYRSEKRSILMGHGIDGTKLEVKMVAFDGSVRIEVGGLARDAMVSINGEEVGQGPTITKNLPGFQELAVTARHPTYRCTAEPERPMLEPNKTLNIAVTCRPKPRNEPRINNPGTKVVRTEGKPPPTSSEGCSDVVGKLTIGTKPMGAQVYVNGKEIGTTPINAYKLPSNCVLKLRLVAPDGREKNETIRLAPNLTSVYNVPFE